MTKKGVGGDRVQRARQLTEVGCHWSGSESGGDAESGPREPEAGNGSEASGVQRDMKATGRSREDGQAEADAAATQVGSDRGREGQRDKRGRGDQAQEWKDFWQHTEEKERGKGDGEVKRDTEEREEKGARMWGGDEFEDGAAVEKGKI